MISIAYVQETLDLEQMEKVEFVDEIAVWKESLQPPAGLQFKTNKCILNYACCIFYGIKYSHCDQMLELLTRHTRMVTCVRSNAELNKIYPVVEYPIPGSTHTSYGKVFT